MIYLIKNDQKFLFRLYDDKDKTDSKFSNLLNQAGHCDDDFMTDDDQI